MSDAKKQTPQVLNNLGFTLIEIVIVLVITSLLVALAVPNFNKILGNYQLDISAREMASDIRDLQQAAIKTQTSTYSIRWYIDTGTYYLHKIDSIAYKTVKLPSSVDIVYTPLDGVFNELNFTTSGIPKSGFGGTIKLKDKATKNEKYVIVDKLGRVRVSELPPE